MPPLLRIEYLLSRPLVIVTIETRLGFLPFDSIAMDGVCVITRARHSLLILGHVIETVVRIKSSSGLIFPWVVVALEVNKFVEGASIQVDQFLPSVAFRASLRYWDLPIHCSRVRSIPIYCFFISRVVVP